MWKNKSRARYDRSRLCYPSDLTDAESAIVGPLIPPAKRGGKKRTAPGGQRAASLPNDLRSHSMVIRVRYTTVGDEFFPNSSPQTFTHVHPVLMSVIHPQSD